MAQTNCFFSIPPIALGHFVLHNPNQLIQYCNDNSNTLQLTLYSPANGRSGHAPADCILR
jgi:hypothetical protein